MTVFLFSGENQRLEWIHSLTGHCLIVLKQTAWSRLTNSRKEQTETRGSQQAWRQEVGKINPFGGWAENFYTNQVI